MKEHIEKLRVRRKQLMTKLAAARKAHQGFTHIQKDLQRVTTDLMRAEKEMRSAS